MSEINPYIFREYDIRGVVDKDLTPEVVELIGKGFGTYLKQNGAKKISLGGDVRLHTKKLSDSIIKGVSSTGLDIINLGAVPTPAQYFSLHTLPVDGGMMITGSHNPPEFNGFKMSLGTAPIYGESIQQIRKIIESDNFDTGNGSVEDYFILDEYIEDIAGRLKLAKPIKAIIDCGNGAGSLVAGKLFRKLNANATMLFCEPDGRFPNHHPDPTVVEYIQDLIKKVKETDAEIGIGYDGDADRIGVVDNNGNIIWGDRLLAVFAMDLLERHKGERIIFDVKCSQALPEAIEAAGGIPVMWKTGHSLLKKKMKETGALVGGEMSGHIFFAENFYGFDDAIYASARLLALLSRSNKTITDWLAKVPKYYSTPEIRAECVNDEEKFKIAKQAADYFKQNNDVIDIDGVRILFGDGWGLVRPSNTQPVIVTRFEAKTPQRLEEIKDLVVNKLKEFGEIKI
jgi:phosphomannomutase/phosphoglucomutase